MNDNLQNTNNKNPSIYYTGPNYKKKTPKITKEQIETIGSFQDSEIKKHMHFIHDASHNFTKQNKYFFPDKLFLGLL